MILENPRFHAHLGVTKIQDMATGFAVDEATTQCPRCTDIFGIEIKESDSVFVADYGVAKVSIVAAKAKCPIVFSDKTAVEEWRDST